MRIGSLCSGYGGLDLAALQLFPASVAWHCEYDPAPSKILEHHWPDVPNYRDITSLDFDSLPEIDILTAGYPCQPFSAAGRRKGTDDERHLWP
jgi:DNA (cytosine-5)-methyltransferase 1